MSDLEFPPLSQMPRPRRRPPPWSDGDIRRARELTAWHAEWVAKWADRAGFHPEQHPKPGSDYNLHHVDLDAPPEALEEYYRRADEIMGRNPTA